jgi:Zn-finger nucleic acid-binding protein
MKCPKCNVTLLMSEKHGIEIDYCPDCRGIWLDRGELDKIIERSVMPENNNDVYLPPQNREQAKYYDEHNDSHSYKYGRRKNFLSELFD